MLFPKWNLVPGAKKKIPAEQSVYRIDVEWIGSNDFTINTGEALQSRTNYYLASTPEGVLNVQHFKDVNYQNLYQGIDLHFYSEDDKLKYDSQVFISS